MMRLADALAEFKSFAWKGRYRDPKYLPASFRDDRKPTIGYRYVCLPDTVDPSGVKGK